MKKQPLHPFMQTQIHYPHKTTMTTNRILLTALQPGFIVSRRESMDDVIEAWERLGSTLHIRALKTHRDDNMMPAILTVKVTQKISEDVAKRKTNMGTSELLENCKCFCTDVWQFCRRFCYLQRPAHSSQDLTPGCHMCMANCKIILSISSNCCAHVSCRNTPK